jgi:hypothetical protein
VPGYFFIKKMVSKDLWDEDWGKKEISIQLNI